MNFFLLKTFGGDISAVPIPKYSNVILFRGLGTRRTGVLDY